MSEQSSPPNLNPCEDCGAYHGGLPLQKYTTYIDALTDSSMLDGCCPAVREHAHFELAALRERVKELERELAETKAASLRNAKDYNMMGGL